MKEDVKLNAETAANNFRGAQKAMAKEIESAINEQVKPLIEAANKLEQSIRKDITEKHKGNIDALYNAFLSSRELLNQQLVSDAASIWYSPGTMVWYWCKERHGNEIKKTDIKGIVEVYDGTQDVPNNYSRWNRPEIGNIIIRTLKKDGTPGIKFENISKYNRLTENSSTVWCAENDTPKTNPYYTKYLPTVKEEPIEF